MSEPTREPVPTQDEQHGASPADGLYLTPRSGMSTPAHDLEEPGAIDGYNSATAAPSSLTAPSKHQQAPAPANADAEDAAGGPGSQIAAVDAQAAQGRSSNSSSTLPDLPGGHDQAPAAPMHPVAADAASTTSSSGSPSVPTLPTSSMHTSRHAAAVSSPGSTPKDSPTSSSAAQSANSVPLAAAMASMHLGEPHALGPSTTETTAAPVTLPPAGEAAAAGTAAPATGNEPPSINPLIATASFAEQAEASGAESAPSAGHGRHVSALSFGSLASDSALDSLRPPSSGASDTGDDAVGPFSVANTADADPADVGPASQPAQNSSERSPDVHGSMGKGEASSNGSELDPEAAVATQGVELDVRRLSSTSPSSDPEAASWEAWQAHKRHFFVVTSAGKPVFSRHGDETALAGFMAIIQAIVSVVADQGDTIRSIQAGSHQLVFLLRGHLYLVAVSSAGEPKVALVRQLEMLYHQMLFIVTTSVERMLQRNPGYDVAQLLAGTTNIHKDLLRSFSRCPDYLLDACEPVPMAAADRRIATEALQEAVRASGALYGLLVSGRRLMAFDCARSPQLHPSDILLTINFVSASESFRVAESFSPVCLPHFKASAFLHAYIACLDAKLGAFLLLLSGSSDAFFALSAARGALETRLRDAGVVQRLVDVAGQPGGGRQRIEALPKPAGGPFGTTPLWHYCIRFPARKQLLVSAYSEAFQQPSQQKAIIRAYARLHCSAYAAVYGSSSSSTAAGLHGRGLGGSSSSTGNSSKVGGASGGVGGGSFSSGGAPGSASAAAAAAAAAAAYMLPGSAPRPARLVWVTGRHWVTVCCSDKEVELYVVMDPLTDKELGTKVCEQLRQHYSEKARQQELLLPS